MTAAALGTLLGSALIHLLRAARTIGTRPGPDPVFGSGRAGDIWRPCHTTNCAHLHTIHRPQPDGTYACAECGNTRKETDR